MNFFQAHILFFTSRQRILCKNGYFLRLKSFQTSWGIFCFCLPGQDQGNSKLSISESSTLIFGGATRTRQLGFGSGQKTNRKWRIFDNFFYGVFFYWNCFIFERSRRAHWKVIFKTALWQKLVSRMESYDLITCKRKWQLFGREF